MSTSDFTQSLLGMIVDSLNAMKPQFTSLSRIRLDNRSLPAEIVQILADQKIQERPFAYEFFHHIRKYWENGERTDVTDTIVIQGEVNKFYQNIPHLKKAPDFLFHKPGNLESEYQVAVIEFKLATNLASLEYDFEKLLAFGEVLGYQYLIEVLLGTAMQLETAIQKSKQIADSDHWPVGGEIIVVPVETTTEEARCSDPMCLAFRRSI